MKTIVSVLLVTGLLFLTNDLRSEILPGKAPLSGRPEQRGFYDIKPDSVPPYDPGPFGRKIVDSPTAEIRSTRGYLSFSSGGASAIKGPYEMENFYSPEWSYSVDFGININSYVIILPIAFSLRDFKLNGENFNANFWANKDYLEQQKWHGHIDRPSAVDYQATSSYRDFSYIPAVVIFSPGYLGIRGFARIGAGICSGNFSITHQIKYRNIYYNTSSLSLFSDKKSFKEFVMLYGAGLEYTLSKKFGLLFEMRYNVIYSGKANSNLNSAETLSNLYRNPLLFYYMTPEGLKIHSFMEEKNLTTFDLRYGMTYRF